MNRPSWDEYYMDMAFLISQKSLDPSTKHGCIVVDNKHTPLSMGYNSPPRDCIDENIPLTRPEKYPYMVHAEENAMLNAARSGVSLIGSTFYITGYPCSRCFRGIKNVEATTIIYGPVNSNCISEEDKHAIEIMNQKYASYEELLFELQYALNPRIPLPKVIIPRIKFIEYKGEIGKVLDKTKDYINQKCNCKV